MNIVFDKMKLLVPKQNATKCRENGDFLITLNYNLDIYYLNEISKDFYLLCDEKRTILDIVLALKDIYEVEISVLESDIIELIRDLQWKKIITLKEKQ